MGLKCTVLPFAMAICPPLIGLAETSPAFKGQEYPLKVEAASKDQCKAIAETYPELKEYLNTGPVPLSKHTARSMARACLEKLNKDQEARNTKSGLEEFGPRLKDLVVNPYDYFVNRSPKDYQKVYESCVRHESCLTKLYLDAEGDFPSPKQLGELKTINLNKFGRLIAIAHARMNSESMQVQIQKDRIENQKFLRWQYSNGTAATEHPDHEQWMFWDMINNSLNEYQGVWQCLKPEVSVELFCYNLSLYVGPAATPVALGTRPPVNRILEALSLRSRKLDGWVGQSIKIPGEPKVTDQILKHIERRHLISHDALVNLLAADAPADVLFSETERRSRSGKFDFYNETTVYPPDITNNVLGKAFQTSVTKYLSTSRSVQSALVEVSYNGELYRVRVKSCLSEFCAGEGDPRMYRQGEVIQAYIVCGNGGGVLPPLNCFHFLEGYSSVMDKIGKPKKETETAIDKCRKYFPGGGIEKRGETYVASGHLRALQPPRCK